MMHRTSTATLLSLFVALSLTCVSAVQAKVLTIWPGSFKADKPNSSSTVRDDLLYSASTYETFTFPLRLPVGTTLQSAVVSWKVSQLATVAYAIVRKPFNGEPETIAWFGLANNPTDTTWAINSLTFSAVDPVIRRNFLYFIRVNLQNGGYFGGFKINYSPPTP